LPIRPSSATHEASVNVLSTAAGRAIQTSLEPLEQRLATAHEQWSSARDPAFVRRQIPRVERMLRYFAPEVRHAERVPATRRATTRSPASCRPASTACGMNVPARS